MHMHTRNHTHTYFSRYTPGVLIGGEFTHDCGAARGVGYFALPLLMLAPFAKQPLVATPYGT